jgi:Lar family restriction alleviation protein
MAEKLKPCPFCGNEDITITEIDELYQTVCSVIRKGCGAASGYQYSRDKAINAWNRRTNNESKTD